MKNFDIEEIIEKLTADFDTQDICDLVNFTREKWKQKRINEWNSILELSFKSSDIYSETFELEYKEDYDLISGKMGWQLPSHLYVDSKNEKTDRSEMRITIINRNWVSRDDGEKK
jgi:hypothetical protein